MGRIKTQMIKRVTNEIFEKHRDQFKESFEENKAALARVADINSKKLRNVVAGYITRLMRVKETI